jgi:hypothetical protein
VDEMIDTDGGELQTATGNTTATEQITAAALDYIEGWFDGDAERMRRALHAELAKRSLETDDSGVERLETLTADQMIGWTAEGIGRKRDPADRCIEITVDHVDDRIATARCMSALYVDYLQLVRTPEAWIIVNVLWSPR